MKKLFSKEQVLDSDSCPSAEPLNLVESHAVFAPAFQKIPLLKGKPRGFLTAEKLQGGSVVACGDEVVNHVVHEDNKLDLLPFLVERPRVIPRLSQPDAEGLPRVVVSIRKLLFQEPNDSTPELPVRLRRQAHGGPSFFTDIPGFVARQAAAFVFPAAAAVIGVVSAGRGIQGEATQT